jgi:hypothetical protein
LCKIDDSEIHTRIAKAIGLKPKRYLMGNSIKISKAPKPTEIYWANLGYPSKAKLRSRILTAIITGFIILVSFGILVAFNKWQVKFLLILINKRLLSVVHSKKISF